MSTVAVVVLNWNGWDDTLACLESLLGLEVPPGVRLELIVCDNGSDDDSLPRISAWLASREAEQRAGRERPAVTLLANGRNLGFAGGMNAGIRRALEGFQADFCWLLNNDTRVAPDSLRRLLACAEARPRVAVWGSTICDFAHPSRVKSAGGCRYSYWLTSYRPLGAGLDVARVQSWAEPPRLDYVDGSAMFIRREALQSVGLLNEEYFLYFEELDYACRLREQGLAIGWCRESLIHHRGGESVQRLTAGPVRDPRRTASYFADLSAFKFTWIHRRGLLWLAVPARIGGRLLKIAMTGNGFLLRSFGCACGDFLRWLRLRRRRE